MIYPDEIVLVLTYRHNANDDEIFTERVAAKKVGENYKLLHVPAFAPNIAYGDIVKVEFDDGEFHFDELIEESGFSTAHIVIWNQKNKGNVILELGDLGCGVNTNVSDDYIVVSIPPAIQYLQVRNFLINEKSVGNIDFKDCLSKIHAASL